MEFSIFITRSCPTIERFFSFLLDHKTCHSLLCSLTLKTSGKFHQPKQLTHKELHIEYNSHFKVNDAGKLEKYKRMYLKPHCLNLAYYTGLI